MAINTSRAYPENKINILLLEQAYTSMQINHTVTYDVWNEKKYFDGATARGILRLLGHNG